VLRRQRERLSLGGELALAALPTVTVLGVLAAVEALTTQRLLFASLASSAFLIYLDPEHGANRVAALVVSQLLAACLGWGTYAVMGPGYGAAAVALVGTILGMIVLDVVHPPAAGTAMSFALRAGGASNLALFVLALGITVVLVAMQRAAVWALVRFRPGRRTRPDPDHPACPVSS
jgi:CBS-domain-containing membrane protein